MKMAGMKKLTKKLAFPLFMAAVVFAGVNTMAQTEGDIVSLSSDRSDAIITASGELVDIRITLNGSFEKVSDGGTSTGDPMIRLNINGTVAWAKLDSLSRYILGGAARTDVIFNYTVKPGDMASPMALHGYAGGSIPGGTFQFIWNGWQISKVGDSTTLADWRFDTDEMIGGDNYDPNFTEANVILRTLVFDDANSPTAVAATETVSWRVSTVNPIESSVVDFYIWPEDPGVAQVGSTPGQALLVSMPSGSTQVDFAVRGLAVGSTDIYLQRTADYLNNDIHGVTNYVKRAITVTPPPEPTVRIIMIDNGSDNISMDETGILSTGNFRVELSEPYASDVTVHIDTSIAGTAQDNVTFASDPFTVRVSAGDTASPDAKFNVPDGTQLSAATGVTLTPTIQEAAAQAHYSRVREATVYVNNVTPVITRPESSDSFTITRGVSTGFDFTVADVPADRPDMITRWNFGDSTPVQVYTGHVGQAFHTYTTTGNYLVKVQAHDKDGALSSEVQFAVEVNPPLPKPSVTITPSSFVYQETTANATGELMISLSDSFTEDVYVRLETDPAVQNNIILSTTNAFRISAGTTNRVTPLRFSVVDGTAFSELTGITLKPVVTNAAAAAHYTDLKETTIFIENVAPVIVQPLASDLGAPADSTYGYDQVPMGRPFNFDYDAFDVPNDRATMQVNWTFGDGASVTTVGAQGSVSHTYSSLGPKIVRVQAIDKDGGISEKIEFKVNVVQPPPPPSVRILAPAFELVESDDPFTGQITVQLTEAFTNLVVVDLSMNMNNVLELSQDQVIFGVGEVEKIVYLSPVDGTQATKAPGVLVTPNVIGTAAAVAHYTTEESGYVRIANVVPEINNPVASDITSPTSAYSVPQGAPWRFYWTIKDVQADLPSMSVTWIWGDGQEDTLTGGNGYIEHTYDALGDMIIRVIARDKDDGRTEVSFKITVLPSKAVNVTPIGPNVEAGYYGALKGNGRVSSPEARTSENRNNTYFFKYDPNVLAATLEAVPYKAQPSYHLTTYDSYGNAMTSSDSIYYDSFFYVWVGADQGIPDEKLVPVTSTPVTSITLPEMQGDEGGGSTSVEIRDVQAIFSREFYIEDNMGDINQDGIPDQISHFYGLAEAAAAANNPGNLPADMVDANGFNGDEDYLPGAASGGGAIIGGAGTTNVFAAIGDPFTAILEIRGFDSGLNYPGVSDPSGLQDEPGAYPGTRGGTNPLLEDTDGDNFPDGWEYYFWYNARFQGMTGERYNPNDVAQGTPIESKVIEEAFNPLIPATDPNSGSAVNRDLDNDGLYDIEELVIGTNPVHWDTDGDGMCDGWEVFRGLNPNDSRDGLDSTMNNPDGDYMAYATVPRQWVTAVGNGQTNNYISVGASQGDTNGTFNAWYNYGNSDDPIAMGEPIELPDGAVVVEVEDIEVLLLHFQVRDEFGFDPRTAWTDSIDTDRFAGTGVQGAAPNTRPFTSRDEYMLMKFMVANGYAGSIAPTVAAWSLVSTDPRTPDTDAGPGGTDGVPDGWELYVATQEDSPNTAMRISPWDFRDHDQDPDEDGLSLRREYAGLYSSAQYASPALYTSVSHGEGGYTTVSIVPSAVDQHWVNKFWPTNPWDLDTDGDGVSDSVERSFIYGNPVDGGGLCTPGGGLNPCSKDTDRDALPDAWELQFYGTPVAADGATSLPPSQPGQPGTPVSMVITNGMDGTVPDHDEDWDNDGLLNYQEYWVQAIRGFRYDLSLDEVPMDETYDVSYFFEEVTTEWDIARYPWGTSQPASWLMMPVVDGAVYTRYDMSDPSTHSPLPLYASTDPRNADTDGDGMDDYYEMYHGLNPILGMGEEGDIIANVYDPIPMTQFSNPFYAVLPNELPMNFMLHPWLAGLPEADPDGDGLLNFEEMLLANTAAAPNFNTDPTPLWMTDYHNPNSLTYKYYFNGSMFFWPGTARNRQTMAIGRIAMFDHEMNEGYDTDNNGVSDKAELVHSRNPQSDPRDHDDPLRRQAIYFSGLNSAARTISSHMHDEWTFRSFTVELWACPDVVNADQVILERSVPLIASNMNDPLGYRARRTFQIGTVADGRVYAKFDSSGSEAHDPHTAEAVVFGPTLKAGEWVHIAARMNGELGKFDILVNGDLYATIDTLLIPATGTITVDNPFDGGARKTYVYTGAIVAGAADNTPAESVLTHQWSGFDKFYQGYLDEVRIWDGARSLSDINNDRSKRYMRSDIEANRKAVRFDEAMGSTRVAGDGNPLLDPELLYHYTFDNIFGGEDAASVALAPRGYMDPAVTTNRPPAALNTAILFGESPVTSTVYTNYEYLSLIENSVEHLPMFGGVSTVDSIIQVVLSDKVPNSVYWSETMAGATPGVYKFPNDNNPYGISFEFDQSDPLNSGFEYFSDMLPLGDAFAKTAPTMWDNQGPSTPWTETGVDGDSDGLPDWWEMAFLGNLDAGWDDVYPDGSGMTNGERYLRDIAAGATPNNPTGVNGLKQVADLDGDGLPDWWEDLYSLDKLSAVGEEGALGDPDRDGLPNIAEYLISEVYKFRHLSPRLFKTSPEQTFSDYYQKEGSMTFGAMFTDHDYIEDYWEDLFDPYFVSSYVYDAHLDNDEDGWSNWAEARYSSAYRNVNPEKITSLLPDGQSIPEYPIPVIVTKLRYNGFREGGDLVINAYSTPDMDGIPDATYTFAYSADGSLQEEKNIALGAWQSKKITVTLTPGSVVPGTLGIQFADQWSGGTLETGYDVDGVMYSTVAGGSYIPIGTINYATGRLVLDLAHYDGGYIRGADWDNDLSFSQQSREAYVIPKESSVEITYSVSLNNTWPRTLYLGQADEGWIREGANYFFVFMDLDGNGAWNAGEPCGLPEQFATEIGWDINQINVELTDYREGYLRFDLATNQRSKDVLLGLSGGGDVGDDSSEMPSAVKRVRVSRKLGNVTRTILDRAVSGRSYIHEGDLFAQGELAFDWSLNEDSSASVVVYSVYVGDEYNMFDSVLVNTFTNTFVNNLASPRQEPAVSTKPVNGAYVYSARPEFRWSMPDLYPAFAIEIRKNSSRGAVVYHSGPVKAPSRDNITGEYIWKAPIHAGNRLPNGQIFSVNTVYAWRVTTLNSRYAMDIPGGSSGGGAVSSGWSDWKYFRLDVNRPIQSSGYGMVEATVKYFGPAVDDLAGNVKVEAYTTRDFNGCAESRYTLTNPELNTLTDSSSTNINAVLRGLTPSQFVGDYYVVAYIDSNGNNKRDVWESWGYANYYGRNELPDNADLQSESIFRNVFRGIAPYDAMPVRVTKSATVPSVTVVIQDADTDQDWFPDAWEWSQSSGVNFLGAIGPSSEWPTDMGNTEVNPSLTTGVWPAGTIALLTFGTTDSDGDGIDDVRELLLGTDVHTPSSPAVIENVKLGLPADAELELNVEGLRVDGGSPELTWNVSVDKPESSLSPAMMRLMSASQDGKVPYAVEFSPSLSNPEWSAIYSGEVELEGAQRLINKISMDADSNPKGFFRVVIGEK